MRNYCRRTWILRLNLCSVGEQQGFMICQDRSAGLALIFTGRVPGRLTWCRSDRTKSCRYFQQPLVLSVQSSTSNQLASASYRITISFPLCTSLRDFRNASSAQSAIVMDQELHAWLKSTWSSVCCIVALCGRQRTVIICNQLLHVIDFQCRWGQMILSSAYIGLSREQITE